MKVNIKTIILFILIIICVIGAIIYFANTKGADNYEEYEPQEEISEEQERQTMISLYFINKTTREVEPEARLIDVKKLYDSPYETLINLLLDIPKNENLEKAIPEGTKLLDTKLDGETLKLNFSTEFIENHKGGKEEEEKTIETIVNTLTELTEVNAVKILINGEENQAFKDGEISFEQEFIREE